MQQSLEQEVLVNPIQTTTIGKKNTIATILAFYNFYGVETKYFTTCKVCLYIL